MKDKIWERIHFNELTLDQTSSFVTAERAEVEKFYDPLALYLLNLRRAENRLMVAVAGPPGSGKTVFATLLAAVINAEADRNEAVVIPLDGWHFPNQYLDTHTIRQMGQTLPLRQMKGSPPTFNTEAAFACLGKIRQGGPVSYPVYSRMKHEPVADGGRVEPFHHIVIVEGNYWLLREAPWIKFRPLFDISIFLAAKPETLLDGLRQRQLRSGRSAEAAEQQVMHVDLPNIELVLKNSATANIVVHKADHTRIIEVEYLNV
jgi:pantothenate kinase